MVWGRKAGGYWYRGNSRMSLSTSGEFIKFKLGMCLEIRVQPQSPDKPEARNA